MSPELLLDSSAVLGYALGRPGVVDLLASLDGAPFGVTTLALIESMRVSRLIGDRLLFLPDGIADYPGFTLVPTVTGPEKLAAAYRQLFSPREDLVATLLAARVCDADVASYAAENYEVAGHVDVLQIEDSW